MTLERVETELTALRHKELRKSPLPGRFDIEHLKGIHEYLFKDVYFKTGEQAPAFAGAIRVIGIEKATDVGIDYPHPDSPFDSLKARLEYAFSELKKDNHLKGMDQDPDRFLMKLAKHSAEIWECHPFRDGNSRTTYLFTEHLAKDAGFPFKVEPEGISAFRTSIADYIRGDKKQFIDQLGNYITPVRELNIVRLPSNEINEQADVYNVITHGSGAKTNALS